MMKKLESGRSMVEMIAVLMILAVVSIAGLVTYDYAKQRWWETQLSQVVTKVLTVAKAKERNVTSQELRLELPKGVVSVVSRFATTKNADTGADETSPYRMAVVTFSMKTLECEVSENCRKFDFLDKFGFSVSDPYTISYKQGNVEMEGGVVDVLFKGDKKSLDGVQ